MIIDSLNWDITIKVGYMLNYVLLFLFITSALVNVGCTGSDKKKKDAMIREAYDKYHPTYGYRNDLPDKNFEVSDENESMWQRPPERTAVYRTPDGPETGSYPRAPIGEQYLGYKEGDDAIIRMETRDSTTNLTTRQPVGEMPDYLQGNYGSTTH